MPSFEEQLTALESVVDRLERGELSLDDSVRLFEQGIKLSNACKQELEAAEGKIQILVNQSANPPILRDLTLEDEDDEEAEAEE